MEIERSWSSTEEYMRWSGGGDTHFDPNECGELDPDFVPAPAPAYATDDADCPF